MSFETPELAFHRRGDLLFAMGRFRTGGNVEGSSSTKATYELRIDWLDLTRSVDVLT
jgi:ketosteroid isomerase-like protein